MTDAINPNHYKSRSIECITVTEKYPFTVGNAIKYAWRAGQKDALKQDLQKCLWYVERANNATPKHHSNFGYAYFEQQGLKLSEFNSYPNHGLLIYSLINQDFELSIKLLNDLIEQA